MDELRDRYGSRHIPEGKSLSDILNDIPKSIDADVLRNVFFSVKNAEQVVSPQDLQERIRQHFVPALKLAILADMAGSAAEDAGGLGGLKLAYLIQNQLKAPGMERRLSACGSLDDLRGLAGSMDLRKTIGEYRSAMASVVSELQGIYGKYALPADLEGVLRLCDIETGISMKDRLDTALLGQTEPTGSGEVKELLRDVLLPNMQHGYIEKAVESAARELSVPMPRRLCLGRRHPRRRGEQAHPQQRPFCGRSAPCRRGHGQASPPRAESRGRRAACTVFLPGGA